MKSYCPQIRADKLRAGFIMQARSQALFSKVILWGLTKWIRRDVDKNANPVWGSHTSLVVEENGVCYIGDSMMKDIGNGHLFPFSRCTPVETWNKDLLSGAHQGVRFFEVIGATELQEHQMSAWWMMNVCGRPYDIMAFPKLLIKCLIKSFVKSAAGWRWAWFCSEGVEKAVDYPYQPDPGPIGSAQATPLTFEKCAGWYGGNATLREVTFEVLDHAPTWMLDEGKWKEFREDMPDTADPLPTEMG